MPSTAGVIGWPVSHSLSPKLHGYWLKRYHIDGEYVPWAVKPEALAAAIKSLPGKGWKGCNITVPHKEMVVAMMDSLDAAAQAIGAVNTVAVRDGALYGSNTDAYGFIENIRPHMPARKRKAVVLGAGGAARAVCYALLQEGFGNITVTNRTYARTQAMREDFGGSIDGAAWERRNESLEGADVLVNTTSLGLAGKAPLDINLSLLPKTALVTDIVYTPLMTPLLAQAKARGNPVIDGLGMLIHQAVPGFEAWFGVRPEITPEIRHCLEKAAA